MTDKTLNSFQKRKLNAGQGYAAFKRDDSTDYHMDVHKREIALEANGTILDYSEYYNFGMCATFDERNESGLLHGYSCFRSGMLLGNPAKSHLENGYTFYQNGEPIADAPPPPADFIQNFKMRMEAAKDDAQTLKKRLSLTDKFLSNLGLLDVKQVRAKYQADAPKMA